MKLPAVILIYIMAVKRTIPFSEGIYFITFTCYRWLPLIKLTDGFDLVYKWFDYLKDKGHHIVGFQIMPNHLHAILAFKHCNTPINTIIGNGKRFIAYGIVQRLMKNNQQKILHWLSEGVTPSDRQRGKQHEVWRDSFDWKECRSDKMILQKLEYMHLNSCSGKWQLVESPVDYQHSSAKYYTTGEQCCFDVTHYLALQDLDLTVKASGRGNSYPSDQTGPS